MPNHVYSQLKFKGPSEIIDNVLAQISGVNHHGEAREFTCNAIIPMPDNIFRGNLGEAERKLYGKNNWYDWSCDNWGTKWDVYEVDIKKRVFKNGNTQVIIKFTTAWSPIQPVIKKISEMFTTIEFKFAWLEEQFPIEETNHEVYLHGNTPSKNQLKLVK